MDLLKEMTTICKAMHCYNLVSQWVFLLLPVPQENSSLLFGVACISIAGHRYVVKKY